jgi:hypothetical protein
LLFGHAFCPKLKRMADNEINDQVSFRVNSPEHPKLFDEFHGCLEKYGSERSKVLRELMAAYVRRSRSHGVPAIPFELVEGTGRAQEKAAGRYGSRRGKV